MRKVIEEEFQEHTVISVAHRLSSLRWCDRVIVLDKGKVVELGRPEDLVQKEDGGGRHRGMRRTEEKICKRLAKYSSSMLYSDSLPV